MINFFRVINFYGGGRFIIVHDVPYPDPSHKVFTSRGPVFQFQYVILSVRVLRPQTHRAESSFMYFCLVRVVLW